MLLRRYKADGVGHSRPARNIQRETVKEVAVAEPKSEVAVTEEKPAFTKTDIMRMNKETLVKEATNIGIENADELSGNVLKDKLIEHYV